MEEMYYNASRLSWCSHPVIVICKLVTCNLVPRDFIQFILDFITFCVFFLTLSSKL